MKPSKFQLPRLDFVANFLNSRNVREKNMIVVFLIVGVFVLDYFLWLQPTLRIYGALYPQIGPLTEDLKGLKEDAKNREIILKRYEKAREDVTEKEKFFVNADETPALLENLSQKAQRSGVKITTLEPMDAVKSAGANALYVALPIQIKATAGTHELGAFLSELETQKPFFRVRDLKISSNPLNERKHQIEMSMEIYRREK